MKTSTEIGQLAAALAAAQGEFTNPERNRDVEVQMKAGGKYSFAYLTLDAGIQMARPCLTKNGLAFSQFTENDEHGIVVTTKLMHSSGEWMESELGWGLGGGEGIQQLGSVLSYLKRYSLFSMLGITAETEDDDGNEAAGNKATFKPRTQPAQRTQSRPVVHTENADAAKQSAAAAKETAAEKRRAAIKRIRDSQTLEDLETLAKRLEESTSIDPVGKVELKSLIDDQRKWIETQKTAFDAAPAEEEAAPL